MKKESFIGMKVFRIFLAACIVFCIVAAAYASIAWRDHCVWAFAAMELLCAGNLLRMTIGYEDWCRKNRLS